MSRFALLPLSSSPLFLSYSTLDSEMPSSTPPQPPQPPLPPLSALRRTTLARRDPTPASASIVRVPPSQDWSDDALLHLMQHPQPPPADSPTATAAQDDSLPTPSLEALAEMDLTALRQLALQRGDQVSAAFQAFRSARNSSQYRRDYMNRMLDQVNQLHSDDDERTDAEEGEGEGEQEQEQESAYFDDLFDRSGELHFFPPPEMESYEDEDDLGLAGFGDNLTDEEADMEEFGAHWPGLLAEHPLNDADDGAGRPFGYHHPRPSPPPQAIPHDDPSFFPPGLVHPSFFPSPHATSSLAPHVHATSDPSSSTSPSSFLRPGVVFQGHQSFERRARESLPSGRDSTIRRTAARDVLPSAAPTRNYSITPAPPPGFPSLLRATPMWAEAMEESDRDEYLETLRHLGIMAPNGGARGSGGETSATTAEDHTRAVRERMDRLIGSGAGATLGRGRQLEDEVRRAAETIGTRWRGAAGAEAEGASAAAAAGRSGIAEGEQWGVKVIIHTHDPTSHAITGMMHAVGVPSSPQPITTFFTGTTINLSGGEPLWSTKDRTKQDAEYWTKLGPFQGLSKEELKARVRDRSWLTEMTKGWVLMRWKERDFVNVAPAECTLTIAGHYLVAMNRSTGAVEGLYCDPTTPPYQRLTLSPAMEKGAFVLGTFGVR